MGVRQTSQSSVNKEEIHAMLAEGTYAEVSRNAQVMEAYMGTEAAELTKMIAELVQQSAPQLLEPFGIGVDTAAEILVVAGDNPERIKSEAALAKLAGSLDLSPLLYGWIVAATVTD